MIVKTTGLVLRQDAYSKTSQVITWLTPDHGRVVTLAKGAKRAKSQLVGQYDCFYTCEILFYLARHGSVHILKECSPVNERRGFREAWRGVAGASYICDLLNRLSPPGASCPALFAWAEETLDFFATHGVTETVVHWTELKLLKLLGMSPMLSGCTRCNGRIEPGGAALFSVDRGGLLCPSCDEARSAITIKVSRDVLAMLRGWERSENPMMARRTTCTPAQMHEAGRLLGGFLGYHLESTRSREIIRQLL